MNCFTDAKGLDETLESTKSEYAIYPTKNGSLSFFRSYDRKFVQNLIIEIQSLIPSGTNEIQDKQPDAKILLNNYDESNDSYKSIGHSMHSDEAFSEAKRAANENGLLGEVFVNDYLEFLKKNKKIETFEWISNVDKYSAYDFSLVKLSGIHIFIDAKSTKKEFEQPIYVSYRELKQMAVGRERYDIYRVYEMNGLTAKLRICKDLRAFAKNIIRILEGLPEGVSVAANVMISPSSLEFGPEINLLRD